MCAGAIRSDSQNAALIGKKRYASWLISGGRVFVRSRRARARALVYLSASFEADERNQREMLVVNLNIASLWCVIIVVLLLLFLPLVVNFSSISLQSGARPLAR